MKNKRGNVLKDMLSGSLLLTLSGICILGIFLMTKKEMIAVFWPIVVCFLLGFCSLFIIIRSLINIYSHNSIRKKSEEEKTDKKEIEKPDYFKVGFVLLSIFIYSFLNRFFGFWLSTPFFIITVLYFMGERKIAILVVGGILTTIVFIIFFGYALGTPLPKGMYVFRNISNFLYD